MSGFPVQISAPQKITLRTSGYWQRTFVAFNPGEIVFQAESDDDISDNPFLTFNWSGTIEGAYTDVWQGMVCYISSPGDDFQKAYKYRGRVRLAPSATEFFIDLNATTLEAGDIITVVRDADLAAKVRDDTLVDGSIAYHNLPPMTEGMPSVLALYDADNDGTVEFTPTQVGIAVADGASIATYAWDISGNGSSSISNPAATNPDFTFEAGYHYLLRLITTDSNGVENFLIIQVYAVTRTFTAPVVLPAAAGNVNQDLDTGYAGTITAYGGVADLPYRTHAVIFCVEHFGDNSSTPIVTNVLMHGRLRSESILSEGSAESGAEQLVTYPIEGITAYMQRLKMPDDIIRETATPNEWGEMVNPTPYRMAVYALYAYTTLLNLVSFSAGASLFAAWRIGGEPVGIDGGNTLDVLKSILDRIKAGANYAPDGEIRSEINASYTVDRSGLVTIVDLLPGDTRSITLDIDNSRNVGQVIGFGGSWNTVTDDFDLYTAQSPSIPYSEAPEIREINRELLEYDSTVTEASTELGTRTGNDFAFNNPKWLLSLLMLDQWRWMVATNYQRWTLTYTDSIRAIALTTANKFQCQSVGITINVDGTFDTSAELYQETEFTDAQSIASQLPDNVNAQPVLPVLSNYPSFPTDPLENYPTTTPTDEELQPIDPYSAWQGYTPYPPDQAAQAANQQGTARCKSFQVLARNSGMTNSPFLTVNTAPYTLKISGFARVSADSWELIIPVDGLSLPAEVTAVNRGTFMAGVGIVGATGGGFTGVNITLTFTSTNVDTIIFDADLTIVNAGMFTGFFENTLPQGVVDSLGAGTYNGIRNYPLNKNGITTLNPIVQSAQGTGDGTSTLRTITLRGTGTPPAGATSTGAESGDWFYRVPDDTTLPVELFDVTAGGLIDGNKPAIVPDYNPDHVYTIPFTGTGNVIQAAYALADYTDVSNNAFTIQACRL